MGKASRPRPSPDLRATLRLRVQPGASREAIEGWRDGALRVRVAARPVDGEANRAVIALLAGALGIRPGALHIVRGVGGREKLLQIQGLDPVDIARRLGGEAAR